MMKQLSLFALPVELNSAIATYRQPYGNFVKDGSAPVALGGAADKKSQRIGILRAIDREATKMSALCFH
ncbi:hypothetical protein J2Y53_002571 [Sphingopyxis sp. BE122]|uniref:hypothetical protein n=1 Tax=Sphingopyxis sp. BE122 TaxID=2817841 RepID=UPI002865F864|nr:hypothetical protein [Sphingopyxis sp. BE122]MDR6834238.1 hypothetical protein [Sphingopyxis sp. BE122]